MGHDWVIIKRCLRQLSAFMWSVQIFANHLPRIWWPLTASIYPVLIYGHTTAMVDSIHTMLATYGIAGTIWFTRKSTSKCREGVVQRIGFLRVSLLWHNSDSCSKWFMVSCKALSSNISRQNAKQSNADKLQSWRSKVSKILLFLMKCHSIKKLKMLLQFHAKY